MHMQAEDIEGTFGGTKTNGIWEMILPNTYYDLHVSVGDAQNGPTTDNSLHIINAEGTQVVRYNEQDSAEIYTPDWFIDSATVYLADGRLTLDAPGGNNTKISTASIAPTVRPSVAALDVANQGSLLRITSFNLPKGFALDATTFNNSHAFLTLAGGTNAIAAQLSYQGGILTLIPDQALAAETDYTLHLTNGIQDIQGARLIPFVHTFPYRKRHRLRQPTSCIG